jgi:CheY-like chemotaxis protein
MAKRKRFGEILLEAGVVDTAGLEEALQAQKGSGKRLGQVLEERGVVSEEDIAEVLARQFGFKHVRHIARYSFPQEILQMIDGETALEKLIFPLKKDGHSLYLAAVNPLDMTTFDQISFRTGLRTVPCVTTPSEIHEAVNRHYSDKEETDESDWWTILVVDDQEMVRTAVLAALKRDGYNTMQATNGAEGLKVALQSMPHLVIADTVMPRMDGFEMYRALQANHSTRDIPVIALSTKSTAEEEAKALDMGYLDFVAKPINPVRLVARVKRALRIAYGDGGPPAGR